MSLTYAVDEATQAPSLSDENKIELVKYFYGIQSGELINLSGYEDINFRLKNIDSKHLATDVVVKISNPIEARDSRHLDLQNEICQLLNLHEVPAPVLIPMIDGKLWDYTQIEKEKLPIRMFQTLPGDVLEKFDINEHFLIELGKLISKMHNIFDEKRLQTNHLPFISPDNYECFFREINILFLKKILDEDRSKLALKALEDYRDNIFNKRLSLDFGLIHSDLNETNILTQLNENSELQISGVLDFGDIHMSFRGCDIGACALYLYLSYPQFKIETIILHLLEGYEMHKEFKYKHLLIFCIRARLACSLIYGLRTSRLSVRQDNPDYILKTQSNGWEILRELSDTKTRN